MLKKFYPAVYRIAGVRNRSQLAKKNGIDWNNWEFPKNAHYHYYDNSKEVFLPTLDNPLLKKVGRAHVLNITSVIVDVPVIVRTTGLESRMLDFHRHNRLLTRQASVENLAEITDGYLTMTNYEFLKPIYRVTQQALQEFNQNKIVVDALINNVNQMIQGTNREQFIPVYLDGEIPLFPNTVQYLNGLRTVKERFSKISQILILELMRWLSPAHRESSKLNLNVNGINKSSYASLLLIAKNKLVVVNLGVLESMIDGLLPKVANLEEGEINTNQINEQHMRSLGITTSKLSERETKILLTNGFLNIQRSTTVDEFVEPTEDEIDEEGNVSVIEELLEDAELLQTQAFKSQSTLGSLDTDVEDWSKPIELVNSNIPVTDIKANQSPTGTINKAEGTIEAPDKNSKELLERLAQKSDTLGLSKATENTLKADIESFILKPSPFPEYVASVGEILHTQSNDLEVETYTSAKRVTTLDESMLKSSTQSFDETYLDKAYRADTLRVVDGLHKANVVVSDYNVSEHSNAVGGFELHKLTIRPIDGNPATLTFKMPKIDENGEIKYNNTSYRLKKQVGDLPIRKISRTQVALTSYYGKLFIQRNSNVSVSQADWLLRLLSKLSITNPDEYNIVPTPVYRNVDMNIPYWYSNIAVNFSLINYKGVSFNFNYKNRFKLLTKEEAVSVSAEERDNKSVYLGKQGEQHFFMLNDYHGKIYTKQNDVVEDKGTLLSYLNLPNKYPMEEAIISIMGVKLPLIILFGYLRGLKATLDGIGAEYVVKSKGDKYSKVYEKQIAFPCSNGTLVVNLHYKKTELLLSPLIKYENLFSQMRLKDLNEQGAWFAIAQAFKANFRQMKEIELLNDMFIDPITRDVLVEIHEPTEFIPLVNKALYLLTTQDYLDTSDKRGTRLKGYERINGFLYTELVKSVRDYRGRKIQARQKLEMNPIAVWSAITTDPTFQLKEDVNPIQTIKERDLTTLTGAGGRSKDALTIPSRIYTEGDLGFISGDTVDSGDVGVAAYLSADPKLRNLRGILQDTDPDNLKPAQITSTPSLLSACVHKDDAKRRNFVSIQHSHTIAAANTHAPTIRTGMESIIADRVGVMYAQTAKESGTVVKVTKQVVVVKYGNKEKAYPIGKMFGRAEGKFYPHTIETAVKEGDIISKGDAITYNPNFFDLDPVNPKMVVLKTSKDMVVYFVDRLETNEDSSVVSKKVSKEFTAKTTKVKKILVSFDNHISAPVKVGDEVLPLSPLMYITDIEESEQSILSEAAKSILMASKAQVPQSSVTGVVSDIEIFYRGNIEDMTPSIKAIAENYNKRLKQKSTDTKTRLVTGEVDENYRIMNDAMPNNHAEMLIYIDVEHPCEVSDKIVVGHQMKSVIGDVFTYTAKTHYGAEVDIMFSMKSVGARIVTSVLEVGGATTILRIMSKRIAEDYLKS